VRSNKAEDKKPPVRTGAKKEEKPDANVGDALRAVYQDAISENVPDEMLDLLRKLG
jgi:hypothetical protein